MELRNIEEVGIERIIVQVLDKNSDQPILTDAEVEPAPAINAFLTHHIVKSLGTDKNRKLKMFNPSGVVYGGVKSLYNEGDFVKISKQIAEWMFKCMGEHPVIPSGDLVVCQFSAGGQRCLALMLMEYKASFVHDIAYEEDGFTVDIVTQEINFPSVKQKLSRAAFFKEPGIDEFDLVVLDDTLKAEDGSLIEYFQKTFIQGSLVLDHMDKTRIVLNQFEKWFRTHIRDDMGLSSSLCKLNLVSKVLRDSVFKNKDEFIEHLSPVTHRSMPCALNVVDA
jgi:hypothetical protein